AIPYDPTRAGYSFLGWSDTDGGEPLSFPYSPGVTTDITLYALWSADSHTVTYDSKQGSAVSAGSFVTDGYVAAISAPTRSGFDFKGWSATDGGSAVTFPYSPGVTTGITLYALWTAKPAVNQDPMVLEETTTYPGQQAFLPLMGIVKNITVNWGDGTIDGPYSNETWANHNYATPGTYTVTVSGTELTRYGACCRWNETLTKVVSLGSLGITDLQYAFAYAPNLQSVPATLPEGVTNLAGAFYYSYKFNQDLSGWDTSAVTNFENMFSVAQQFNGDISNWDTSSATNMRNMFNNSTFNQNISNWDTHSLTYVTGMFENSAFNNGSNSNDSANPMRADGNKWKLSSVTDMDAMFSNSPFNQDIGNWDVSNVTNFRGTFGSAPNFDQDLSDWDTSSGKYFHYMFYNDNFNNHGQPLESSATGWNLSSATEVYAMFQSNRGFNQDISTWDLSNVTNLNYMFYDASAFNNGGAPLTWDTSNIQSMEAMFANAGAFNADISSWDMSKVISTQSMFYNTHSFQGNINTWDMSKDTNMNSMFRYSTFNQDIGDWDTSNVHYMSYMFADNWSFDQDINSWDTSNVYDMSGMFQSTNFNQPLNSWNVGNVTNMNSMFLNTQHFNQPLADWNVSSVQYMASMFQSSRAFNQPLPNWNMQNAYTTDHMFCDSVFNGDVSNWNTSHIENMSGMFQQDNAFNQDITAWDVSHVRNFDAMFYYAMKFNQPIGVWNVSSAVSTGNMFAGGIFNQPLNDWNVSKLETTYSMFVNNYFFNQDLDKWNTSNLNNSPSMFQNATSFNGDISTWNTSKLNWAGYMFDGATVFNQDISNWDVSHMNNFEAMFQNAKAFNQPIGKWNVSNMQYANRLFFAASAFNQDLSSWNTGNLNSAWGMFYEAYAFNGNVSTWDTHSLQQMQYMFYHIPKFNQDLSNWNFSNVYWADNAFDYTGIKKLNYAKLLISLANQNLHQITIGFGGVRYLDIAAAAREHLSTPVEFGGKGWYIHDAGLFAWSLVTVNKNPDAADIKIGQTLADSSLSGANTNVSGTWSFTDPTVSPTAEDQDVSVTFTPDDDENYEPIVRAVSIHVLYEPRTISFTGTNSTIWVKGTYDASVETSQGSGTVTYSVLSGTCSIDENGILTAIENGTCTFRGTVANDGTYESVYIDGTATLRTYLVTFGSNNGSSVTPQHLDISGTLAAPADPTRAGYTFLGWSDSNGGEAVSFPYTPNITNDITLYALWSADSHSVSFDANGGSVVAAGSFVTDGSLAIPFDPTRAGYTFLGWSATDGGDAVSFPYTPGVATDITLFALWSADSHIVNLGVNGGTVS
ncbi:MAG: BspA family leucine-rich repeat surface protein, partial [Actinomycetes bacterium]